MPVTPVGWCDVDVYTGRRAFTISAQIPWTKPRGNDTDQRSWILGAHEKYDAE